MNSLHRSRPGEDARTLGYRPYQELLSITNQVQHLRFQMRIHDPIKQ
jgi:hypothetical protein